MHTCAHLHTQIMLLGEEVGKHIDALHNHRKNSLSKSDHLILFSHSEVFLSLCLLGGIILYVLVMWSSNGDFIDNTLRISALTDSMNFKKKRRETFMPTYPEADSKRRDGKFF